MKDLIEFCADVAHDFCDGFMTRDELREIVATNVPSENVESVACQVADAMADYEVFVGE